MRIPTLLISLIAVLNPARGGAASAPVAELLEDHPEPLLKELAGQGGGEGLVETRDVFSGKAAIRIIPMQRFRRDVPGWAYRITEHPAAGEYRFVRFAWRADGARGIMLQMHDERDWNIRFTAGVDEPNWGTKFVAPVPPTQWTVVTRDLFAEFGERRIQGIALTVFGGSAGYFDHIYLGRSVEDLDRIDATGLRAAPPPDLAAADLDRLWTDVGGVDAARAYLAFWTLVRVPGQSVPFLRRVLSPPNAPERVAEIERWVAELGDDDFAVREAATRHLLVHREVAETFLRKAMRDSNVGLETRIRIEQILKPPEAPAGAPARSPDRVSAAVRVLEYADKDAARALLDELARGEPTSRTTRVADEARKRAAECRRE